MTREGNVRGDTPTRRTPYRFLFVSAPFSGIEVFFRNLRTVLAPRGDIESTWEWIEFEPRELEARIPPISGNWALKGGLVGRSRVRHLEREGKIFDAALFNHMLPLLFLRDFQRRVPTLLWLDSTPPMVNGFGSWYGGKKSMLRPHLEDFKKRYVRNLYMRCHRILPWTEMVRRSLEQDYGAPAEKMSVLSPGVDLAQWPFPFRPDRGASIRPVNVLFVGREFFRKGGDLLLTISRRPEFRHCMFHIVSHEEVGEVGENVRVYSNLQPNQTDLKRLYVEADIFVLPTRADFAPTNVLCEAMAMGLPVITTSVGGLEEVVRQGETGYVVPPGDVELLADSLRTLVASPETRRRLGDNGRRLVEEHFDLERIAGTIVKYMCEASDKR